VLINGTGFAGATSVSFGAAGPGTNLVVRSDTQLVVAPPSPSDTVADSQTVDVTVTGRGGTSSPNPPGDRFTWYEAPRVDAITPATGPATGGTPVTITGAHFLGAISVTFSGPFGSGTAPTFVVNSDSQITTVTPPGDRDEFVQVTTSQGGASVRLNGPVFSYSSNGT
jgi:hypothetical protein